MCAIKRKQNNRQINGNEILMGILTFIAIFFSSHALIENAVAIIPTWNFQVTHDESYP